MDAPHRAERLHLERAVRTGEVRVPLAEGLLPAARREAQSPRDQRPVGRGVPQLVRGDADVIGLLRDGERRAVAVVERATTGGEDDALGALCLRFFGPASALDDLDLGGPA